MVIICASHVAAGEVIMLFFGNALFPRTHFRIDQTDHGDIIITVLTQLAPAQAALLRAQIALIDGASVQ